jgi:multidrug transporter EmrE-like cation transporter
MKRAVPWCHLMSEKAWLNTRGRMQFTIANVILPFVSCSKTIKVEEPQNGRPNQSVHPSPLSSPNLTPHRGELEHLTAREPVNQITSGEIEIILSPAVKPTSQWAIIRAAAAVAPLWFLAQLCFNASLLLTSVSSNTILSSSSSLFTFCMSVMFLGETFNRNKLMAVLLTVLGVL